jgi:hypothetical protein
LPTWLPPYPAKKGKRGFAQGAKLKRNIIDDAAFQIVQSITQDDNGFGIAVYHQVAREEKRVAVQSPVNHIQQSQKRSGNARIMWQVFAAPAGLQPGAFSERRQQKDKWKVDRVNQKNFLLVRPETGEKFRAAPCYVPDDSFQERLQQRQWQRGQNPAWQVLEGGVISRWGCRVRHDMVIPKRS